MLTVLGDLIADFNLRIPSFPIARGSLLRVAHLDLGPGGATNVAITAARLGLPVTCLGEVGDDRFGAIVLEGLRAEGIDVSGVIVTRGGETPLAGVIVDQTGEPAYLGYPGRQSVHSLPDSWQSRIAEAEALFVDGWVDDEHAPELILQGMACASQAGVPSFFDPGPGNPVYDNRWHMEACALAAVLLATEDEAVHLTGEADPMASARELLRSGPEMVVIKRGPAGCLLLRGEEVHIAPGLPVEARDATGAGDGLDAAVIYGFLRRLPLEAIGALANATGAAKVRKLGTGLNMPTLAEIQEMLERFAPAHAELLSRMQSS
ncbi:MAG: carbohydrate kinase family protein [Chloroflexota bacterium]